MINLTPLSFHSCTLITFIILIGLCTSNDEDDKYQICYSSLISCGATKNVSYPFWGLGRPRYCGHPALQLKCPDPGTYPMLTIGEHKETCWGNNNSRVYYTDKTLSPKAFHGCNRLEVPVIMEYEALLQRDEAISLGQILQQGFKVDYKNSLECSKCENSNGTCGSNGTEFACFHHPITEVNITATVPPVSHARHRKLSVGLVIAEVFFIQIAIICISIALLLYLKKRIGLRFSALGKAEGKTYKNLDAFLKIYGSLAPKRYTYAMLHKITNGYKEKLGEGGYAIVYKGTLSDGRVVAVKLLKQSKGTGEDFINEVASIGRTNHVNIVALLGFCFEASNKRALIYEFMSNGSLDKFAYHGAKEHALQLETLLNIGVGIATGLDYLHRGCNAQILHFDIKPHNILLDDEFRPKISDFGLARLCLQQESTISSLLEAPRGTVGYIAPEVFCRTFGGVSHKSDVYSYGMMILDIVCGRKNMIPVEMQTTSEMYFPQWIYKRLQHGEELANHGNMNDEEKAIERKMILVSLWCIQTYPSNRPSMTKVIEMLLGELESLPMPPESHLSSPSRSANNSLEIISLAE